jgi:hypothetical protein
MECEIHPSRAASVLRQHLRDDFRCTPISRHGRTDRWNVSHDCVGGICGKLLETPNLFNQSLMAFATPSAASS